MKRSIQFKKLKPKLSWVTCMTSKISNLIIRCSIRIKNKIWQFRETTIGENVTCIRKMIIVKDEKRND